MGFIKALLLLIAIPLFGFVISLWVLSDLNAELTNNGSELSIRQICTPEILSTASDLKPLCDEIAPILWMQTGSLLSGGAAILLLISFTGFAAIAGKNRTKIAKIFPALVSSTLIFLAILVVIQGAILTYGAYVAESYAIKRVHFVLIGAIGLGALAGGFNLISSAFKLASKQSHGVLGKKLDPNKHPKLFSLIKEISEKLGARSPEHVIVGLDPNFYVTSADVDLIGDNKTLKGETLYLSLPLARILNIEEIKGIIGHELGHFRGADTYYSLKFAPVYSGLSHAVDTMWSNNKEGSASDIAKLPAHAVLSYIIEVFHTNVSSISREREFEADKAASEIANPKYLASSLLKIGLYAGAWNDLQNRVIDRMRNEGKIARNLSQIFSSIVKYDVNEETIPKVIDSIAEQTVAHPTDSHPPTTIRIEKMGLNVKEIERDLLLVPESTCIELLEDSINIEEELTSLQQQYYVALGVKIPADENRNAAATILAAFGAHMVVADGKIEPEEIDKAEAIGSTLSSNFDSIEFREYCLYPDSLPEFTELLNISKSMSSEAKQTIVDYLKEIAGADSEVCEQEESLIRQVAQAFEIKGQD